MGRGQADREDLLCWLPFCINLSFFPTINLCSSACHLLYYLFLHPTFPYNVLSHAAFYSQLTYSDLDSPPLPKFFMETAFLLLFHTPLLGPVCHLLIPSPPPLGD